MEYLKIYTEKQQHQNLWKDKMKTYLRYLYFQNYWTKFMLESNQIEGERGLNPGDKEAFEMVLIGEIKTVNDILELHGVLTNHLNVDWSGKLRVCNVRVGSYVAPDYRKIPILMKKFIEILPNLNAFQTYCEFELLHCFRDFNGRTGRLLWVNKKIEEGWIFERSFLRQFHYDSLSNFRK